MAIFFNTRKETHPDFRTTSAHPIRLGDEHWPTVEHYVQAQRFDCKKLQAEVRAAMYAFEAKALARQRPDALRNDWEIVRDDVMESAIREKFRQHPCLRDALKATGTEEIIEASPMNTHWAVGAAGTGKNMLGRIMMKIRDELSRSFDHTGDEPESRLG